MAPAGGQDFSALISRFSPTRNRAVPSSPKANPTTAPVAPKDVAADSAEETASTTPATATSAKTGSASTDSKKQAASAENTGQTLNLDASLSSTIMAMMAPPVLSPVDLRKLVPVSGSNLKITADDNKPATAAPGDATTPAPSDKSASAASSQLTEAPASKPNDASIGAIVLPAVMKPVPEPIKSPPAKITPLVAEPVVSPTAPATSPPQVVEAQLAATPLDGLAAGIPPNGTGVALNSQRMKFAAEKNEIAGRTVQKLPGATLSDDSAADDTGKLAGIADADPSGHKKDSFDLTSMMDLPGKTAAVEVGQNTGLVATVPADNSAAQADRVAHLVNQEVLMIRQSGANSLAVSLKLDPHTELFLQLTNHNGQIQASIRCERGNVAGLDSHWGNLQDSLARQNVQLLPLENKQRASLFTPITATSDASAFNPSSQNPRRQMRELPQDFGEVATVKPLSTAKTKSKTSSRQGWESWA